MRHARRPRLRTASRLRTDERGIIGGSLLRMLIVFAVFGFVAIEVGTVVFARITVQDTAERVAAVAADVYEDTGSLESARKAAHEELERLDEDARIKRRGGFVVQPDGGVRVVVRKRASTLVVDKVGFLEDFSVAEGRAVGFPPPV